MSKRSAQMAPIRLQSRERTFKTKSRRQKAILEK